LANGYAAYTFIDNVLLHIFKRHVDPADLFLETLYPRRTPTIIVKKTVGSYISVLRVYSNPQEDGSKEDNTYNESPERP
jgi:hypothetical protein